MLYKPRQGPSKKHHFTRPDLGFGAGQFVAKSSPACSACLRHAEKPIPLAIRARNRLRVPGGAGLAHHPPHVGRAAPSARRPLRVPRAAAAVRVRRLRAAGATLLQRRARFIHLHNELGARRRPEFAAAPGGGHRVRGERAEPRGRRRVHRELRGRGAGVGLRRRQPELAPPRPGGRRAEGAAGRDAARGQAYPRNPSAELAPSRVAPRPRSSVAWERSANREPYRRSTPS